MLGYDPKTGEELERFRGVDMMRQLVRRGYAVASADAYHLTYIQSEKARGDFSRWQDAADALRADHPGYSGVAKLVDDTALMLDLMAADARIDPARIGIAGHSLGGKMAFYTGCLDERVRAILASDFGIGWHQTNWQDD
jgi:dienelactone hydrolase